jgi:hypothetical protein
MRIKSLLLILLLSSSLMSDNRVFNQIIHDNKIDLKSKSLKSWLRVFNSTNKIKSHGFELSNTERFTMLKGLKAKQLKSKKRYSRRLR